MKILNVHSNYQPTVAHNYSIMPISVPIMHMPSPYMSMPHMFTHPQYEYPNFILKNTYFREISLEIHLLDSHMESNAVIVTKKDI